MLISEGENLSTNLFFHFSINMRAYDVALASINAALYALIGYATYLGIFTPVIGVVRFWPAVIIPAAFAVVFGPKVGGLGAAVGIFISDMLIHGNAILSLTVGVPSNFICFYLIGLLSNLDRLTKFLGLSISIILQIIYLIITVYLQCSGLLPTAATSIFIGVSLFSLIIVIVASKLWKGYLSFMAASTVGLTVGSLIIGFGLWFFSQFQPLPTGDFSAPISAIAVWFAWTFLTEAPFLYLAAPPLIEALKHAFKSSS